MAESTTSRWYPFVETPMISNALAPGRRLALSGSYWRYPFFIGATLFGNSLEEKDIGIDCDDEELGLDGEDVLVDCDFEDPSTNQDYTAEERYGYAVRSAYRPMYHEDGKQVIHLGAGILEGQPETSDSGNNRLRLRTYPGSNIVRTRFVDAKINDVDSYTINYFEAAARFGQFTAQAEAFDVNDDDAFDGEDAGEADSITLGINWYVNTNVIFRLDYSMVSLGDNADADGDFEDNDDLNITTLRTEILF